MNQKHQFSTDNSKIKIRKYGLKSAVFGIKILYFWYPEGVSDVHFSHPVRKQA